LRADIIERRFCVRSSRAESERAAKRDRNTLFVVLIVASSERSVRVGGNELPHRGKLDRESAEPGNADWGSPIYFRLIETAAGSTRPPQTGELPVMELSSKRARERLSRKRDTSGKKMVARTISNADARRFPHLTGEI